MMRGQHDLRWTVVAGYEGSASPADALALAQSFLGTAGGRLVVGCVYEGAPLQATAPVRAITADSGKFLNLVIAGSHGRFRLPGFGRGQGGRWIRACRCPVLVLTESQTEAGDGSPVANQQGAI